MDNKELEQMMRSAFQGAEAQPPAGLWDEIARQDLTPKSLYHEERGSRRRLIYAAIAALLLLSGVSTFLILHNQQPSGSGFEYGAIKPARNNGDVALLLNDTLSANNEETNVEAEPVVEEEIPVKETEKKQRKEVEKKEPIAVQPQTPTAKTEKPVETVTVPEKSVTSKPIEKAQETPAPKTVQTATTKPATSTPKPATSTTKPVVDKPASIALSEPSQKEPEPEPQKPAVQQKPDWEIPNLISPNGDGINDCYVIGNLEKYKPVAMSVYTAQGKMIYSTSNYNNDFCGDNLPSDNYFVVLKIKQGPFAGFSRRSTLVIRR